MILAADIELPETGMTGSEAQHMTICAHVLIALMISDDIPQRCDAIFNREWHSHRHSGHLRYISGRPQKPQDQKQLLIESCFQIYTCNQARKCESDSSYHVFVVFLSHLGTLGAAVWEML